VRLRRASDNAEQDFTAGEVAAGTAGSELVTNGDFATDSDWAKGTGWSIAGGQAVLDGTQTAYSALDQTGVLGEGVYLLSFDVTSNNYSQLYFQWSSNAVPLSTLEIAADGSYSVYVDTRNSINKSWKFRFYSATNGNTATIDNVSLKPYTPSASELWDIQSATEAGVQFGKQTTDSAYATTWYDQSGSGNDATQATSTAQPLLIRAGVTNVVNGKAALDFDGVDDFLTAPSYGVSQPIWSASVTKLDPSGSLTNRHLYSTQDNAFYALANSNNRLRMSAGTPMTEASGGYSENQQLLTFAFDSSNSGGWADGQEITFISNDAGTSGISASMDIGRRIAASNQGWNGDIQELVFYPSDQTANRIGIETNINDHYGIY
jgi:hypothetical protein